MIGDRPITLLAFFAAALLHLVVFVLVSYMPIAKLERPTPPSRTRYVVQFQQPAPTTTPTAVPIPPTPTSPMTPVRPVPLQPLPRRPAQPQGPVRVSPRREWSAVASVLRPQPIDPVQRPKRITARKPADVKVRQVPHLPPKKTRAPSQPTPPREPVAPRLPLPQQPAPPAKPALRPSQPTALPAQDVQRQYLSLVSEALQRHKRYPSVARRRGLSGKVVLDFVILPNGQVTEVQIVASQSTRHGTLNQAALRALKRASPLPPFPKALKKPSLRVTLPILYELTER